MTNPHNVSAFIQENLNKKGLNEVKAVDAAEWLDRAGVLKDRKARPGAPLRDMLRKKQIRGADQRGKFWFIRKLA